MHTLALAEALARAGAGVTVWGLGRGGDTGFFRPVDPAVTVRVVPFPAREGEDVGPRVLRSIDVLAAAVRDAAGAGGTGGGSTGGVLHAQDCLTASAVAQALGPGRCVRTVHHLDVFTTPELAACHERAITDPAALVCVSRAVADEVAAGWGRSATVIPNGVDAARFAAAASDDPTAAGARAAWRARLGRYVLAVGGIEPRKGSTDLLRAMAVLARTHPDVALVIAGGETLFDHRGYRAGHDVLAAELGVSPVVLGAVAHEELPALVAAASAMAFLSTREGFGLAAMEALAASVPLVARDLPVLREVLGGAALLVDTPEVAARALGRVLDEAPASRVRRAATGAARAARCTWDDAADQHLRWYGSL